MPIVYCPCRLIAIVFVICVSIMPAAAETLRCKPLYPVFCHNIHVGCSGRSTLATHGFSVSVSKKAVQVAFDNGDKWAAQAPKLDGERVISLAGSRDWIRIDRRGRFSHRIYRKNRALMALGQCERG